MRLHYQILTTLSVLLPFLHLTTALSPPSDPSSTLFIPLNSSFSLNQSSPIPPSNDFDPVNLPNAACGYYHPPYGGNIANDKNACTHALVSMLEEGRREGGVRILRAWTGIGGVDKRVWEGTSTADPNRKCWVRLAGRGPRGKRVVGSFSYDDIYQSAEYVVDECLKSFDRVRGREWGLAEVPHGRIHDAEFVVSLENRIRVPPRRVADE